MDSIQLNLVSTVPEQNKINRKRKLSFKDQDESKKRQKTGPEQRNHQKTTPQPKLAPKVNIFPKNIGPSASNLKSASNSTNKSATDNMQNAKKTVQVKNNDKKVDVEMAQEKDVENKTPEKPKTTTTPKKKTHRVAEIAFPAIPTETMEQLTDEKINETEIFSFSNWKELKLNDHLEKCILGMPYLFFVSTNNAHFISIYSTHP